MLTDIEWRKLTLESFVSLFQCVAFFDRLTINNFKSLLWCALSFVHALGWWKATLPSFRKSEPTLSCQLERRAMKGLWILPRSPLRFVPVLWEGIHQRRVQSELMDSSEAQHQSFHKKFPERTQNQSPDLTPTNNREDHDDETNDLQNSQPDDPWLWQEQWCRNAGLFYDVDYDFRRFQWFTKQFEPSMGKYVHSKVI